MSDNLNTLDDTALNHLFSLEVDIWEPSRAVPNTWTTGLGLMSPRNQREINYCADANAVLPWLERRKELVDAIWVSNGPWRIGILPGVVLYSGISRSFARAAVIAIIRAQRAAQ